MSETSPNAGSDDPHMIDDRFIGEQLPPGLSIYEPEIEAHLHNRPKIDIPVEMQKLQEAIDFKASHGRWSIRRDVIGLIRRGKDGEGDESYHDKLTRERKRGKDESATYGTANINGEKVVLFAQHWDFFAGSYGIVAGEKIQAASDLAINKKLPFVSIYATSGVRQHENGPGLVQMTRAVEAIRNYKSSVDRPHVAVLLGNVWGGISASAVPNADLIVATAGTDYGFAGPTVIEAFNGIPVSRGDQSAEANMIDRNIDVIVPHVDGLVSYLGDFLTITRNPDKHHALNKDSSPMLKNIVVPGTGRIFDFGEHGIAAPNLVDTPENVKQVTLKVKQAKQDIPQDEQLINEYQDLISNANRVDLEFILQHSFTDAVPLYNHIQDGAEKTYPAVVGALAKLGTQPFIVVGTQPSFKRVGNTVIKQPASPGPEDFEYMVRVLEMGERLELPALFVTDTLGAEPTIGNERRGQSRTIARLIMKGIEYNQPAISLVTGALGSGGGLATTPIADHVMMLEKAMVFVAEPRSAASILYKTSTPSRDEIKTTLATMRATAADQLDLGIIDEVVPEGVNPYETANNIHKALLASYVAVSALSKRKMMSQRRHKIRSLRGFDLEKEMPDFIDLVRSKLGDENNPFFGRGNS